MMWENWAITTKPAIRDTEIPSRMMDCTNLLFTNGLYTKKPANTVVVRCCKVSIYKNNIYGTSLTSVKDTLQPSRVR